MKNKFLFSAMGAAVLAIGIYACQEPSVAPDATVVPISAEGPKPTKFVGIPDAWLLISPTAAFDSCKTKKNVTYLLEDGELTWTKDSVYCLCGDVRVPATKTLAIAAGTLVRGVKESAGSLTVLAGARIHAVGIESDPIIFTSSKAVGSRAPQDWGGVIILGNAQINQTAPINIEGFPIAGNTKHGRKAGPPKYGTNVDTNNGESSGEFQYVRIEFGGFALDSVANSEKNGLTLGGVGSGTTIDHVQSSSGQDDGFEWFGGTVNAKYLISHKNLDDDFDTDFGYQGKIQFGVVSRDPARADASKSNGFESDNDGTGSTATPRTSAVFSNFTIIGPVQCSNTVNANFQDGVHIRRRSGIDIHNSVIVGWARHQVFAEPSSIKSIASVAAPGNALLTKNLAVRPVGNTFATVNEPVAPDDVWTIGPSNSAVAATTCPATNATAAGQYRLSGLSTTAWNLANVNFAPLTAIGFVSPITDSGSDARLIDPSFSENGTVNSSSTTFFKGARRAGSDDNGWNISQGWVNWQPETAPYVNDGDY